MTKRDLFIILIKIFGLYFIALVLLSNLPSNMIFVLRDIEVFSVIWLVFGLIITIGIGYLLISKAGKISSILNLNRGFDDDRIDFSGLKNIHIIKFSVLVVGFILFLENIPAFLSYTLFAFKSSVPKGFDQAFENSNLIKYHRLEDYIYWGTSAFNLLMGYLLISNYKKISLFINEKIK